MTELEQELAKVPNGMPYIMAPNYLRIKQLLFEQLPYFDAYKKEKTANP